MTLYQTVIAEVAPELKPLAEAALVAFETLYEDETETPEQNETSFRRYLQFRIDESKAVGK
jgi:hypothetical protein